MEKKCKFCLSVTLWLMVFLLVMSGLRRKEEALAARIAPEILRFHVLANSDSSEDQALKLEVKDLLLAKIRSDLTLEEAASRELVCRYIEENSSSLEKLAEDYMESRGFPYQADVRLEQCEFPEKAYGDMTFPAGTYDAVRVLLGDGQGKNFWCVLYPSLCYLDSTHAVVPDASKARLMAVLPEDDFAALVNARHPESLSDLLHGLGKPAAPQESEKNTEQDSPLPRINIRFKLPTLLGAGR